MMPADLFAFAYIPAWFEQLYELSQMAAPELPYVLYTTTTNLVLC